MALQSLPQSLVPLLSMAYVILLLLTSSPSCTDPIPGFPRLLRRPSLSAPTRQSKRRHCPVIIYKNLLLSPSNRATNNFDNLTLVFRHHDHHHHFCFLGAALIFLQGSACYRHFPLGGNRAHHPCVYLSSIFCNFAASIYFTLVL
jgi:hypothetical protein